MKQNRKNVVLKVSDSGMAMWLSTLREIAPEYNYFSWQDASLETSEVAFIVASNPSAEWINSYTHLEALFSIGSGTDHIRNIDRIRDDIPIVKATSSVLTNKMKQYIAGAITHWHRRFDRMIEANRNNIWQRIEAPLAEELAVGLLGYGNMGQPVSQMLLDLGYNVRVVANKPRKLPNIQYFTGLEQLEYFSTGLDALICLLPHSASTQDVVNRRVFERLNDGACIVNVSRGACLNECDLAHFLTSGKIAKAFLDVCKTEPLPCSSNLWNLPNVLITGHSSAYFGPNEGGKLIAELLRSFELDQNSVQLFDRIKGY